LVVVAFLHALHLAQDIHHPVGAIWQAYLELAVYLAVALPLAWAWQRRRTAYLWNWISEERPAGARERELLLREPTRALVVPATLWGAAAIVFAIREAAQSSTGEIELVLTIVLGGVTSCLLIYLFTERLLRPVTARVLASVPPEPSVAPRVGVRLIASWALASGLPMLGLAAIAVVALAGNFHRPAGLAVAALVLVGAALAAGWIAALLSARSLVEPLGALRGALMRVRAGDLDVGVAVDDGGEMGLLQAGFNDAIAGLRERERLRDLFGRHVGAEAARAALEAGVTLGGELREVAVLFVDLVGSTSLALRRSPQEIVAWLNRFFAVVVDVAEAHGGWVNKFEGDAALCVFGAPSDQPDAASAALAAARALDDRLRRELPETRAGIGVSAGPAVAGHVGAERRLEYTVVGDPINEAARLCELAKERPDRVLASEAALRKASTEEAARWRLGEQIVLRGRQAPTRLAMPADHARLIKAIAQRTDANVGGTRTRDRATR
jgi:adenylate cyclase